MTRSLFLAAVLASLAFPGHAALTAERSTVVLAHLGSFSDKARALSGWTRYQEIAGFPFEGLYPVIVPTDLDDGRHVVRLYAGPFDAVAEAREFCGRVEPETGFCRTVALD